jgi:hypothetical protein
VNALQIDDPAESIPVPVRTRVKVEVRNERSSRTMNHMDPETKAIHLRLEEWAAAVKRNGGNLGYPTESIYTKRNLVRTEYGHEDVISDRVAHVDAAVARLGVIDGSVLRRFYLHWRPIDLWRRLPGIPNEGRFKVVLRRARWRVDGYLSAIESL